MTNNQIKVLLIEDNPGDVRLIRKMMGEAANVNIEIECVDRLDAGLRRLVKGDIDVVLLDLGLPDSQGFDTFRKLHSQAREVPLIVLTGLDDEELGLRAVQKGAQDYLIKGKTESNLLIRAVRYAIERKQTEVTIKESEEKFKTLAEQSPNMIFINKKGRIVYANKRCEEIMGYKRKEL